MSLTDVSAGETVRASTFGSRSGLLAVVTNSAIKAFFVALSGMLLTCSLAVVLWAITPSSGGGPIGLLRAGLAAFSSGNGMTVTIGQAALSMPPLMITVMATALLTTVSGRGRVVAGGRGQELAAVLAAVVTYAAVVACAGVILGPPHAVQADQWWRPALLALAVVGCTTALRGDGWRPYLRERVPAWVPISIRLGAAGIATMIGGGAIVLAVGLIRSFNDATTVQLLGAPGVGGGFGMAMLGIAYLPNAVVAGAGYASGVGFTVGTGIYRPFGSTPTELPAVSLLTAVPDSSTVAWSGLLVLIVPLLAAVLIGRGAVRRLDGRLDRLCAVAGAAVFAGIGLGLLAAVASGGVAGGQWPTAGVPPVLFALVVAVGLGAVGAGVAALGRVRAAQLAGFVQEGGERDQGQLDQEDVENDELVDDVAPDGLDVAPDGDDVVSDGVDVASGGELAVESAGESPADETHVPVLQPREEDLIAAAEAETDEDLIGELTTDQGRRQAG